MAEIYAMSYPDSVRKSLEILKRDGLHVSDKDGDFSAESQLACMSKQYREVDPDACASVLRASEGDKKILMEESKFIIKSHLMDARNVHISRNNFERYMKLAKKYKLLLMKFGEEYIIHLPISLSFSDLEYKLKKEHPNFCRPIASELDVYTNFKKEFVLDGIFGLLPAGKSYGGFVKAYFHVQFCNFRYSGRGVFDSEAFQNILGIMRVTYNSKIFSNDERVEWFDKLGIKTEDCALWSSIFDKQFPGYKDLHKFFGQIA